MTDAELRDAAVAHLKQTTVGYKNKHWTVPPTGSEWEQALDLLGRISQPAPVPPPPPPPPPPSGSLYFASDWESGSKIPPWAGQSSGAAGDVVIAASIDGIAPRKGSKFAKFLARTGVTAFGNQTGRIATMVQTGSISGAGALGDDFYTGWSLYLPNGFQFAPADYANNIIEWHCPPGMSQAPIHFLLDGAQNGAFSLDLHTDCSGYNPKPHMGGWKFDPTTAGNPLGTGKPMVTGRWVDFVIHVKWATDSSGIVEGWMDGTKRFSQNIPTVVCNLWQTPYLIVGYYGSDKGHDVAVYLDEIKVGDSYDAVAPA